MHVMLRLILFLVYLAEIPPAAIRGAMVSSWQLFLAIGQVIGAVVAQGMTSQLAAGQEVLK
jgi:hypothetical protein